MVELVTLQTDRLVLRPFALADAARVRELAGDVRIATTTVNIPHPYPEGVAETWILTHGPKAAEGKSLTWAITRPDLGVIGGIGLELALRHMRAELGYWIGHPFWRQGYATEAGAAVLEHAFTALELNRIHATYMTRNPASGRVMQKLGMTREGRMPQHFQREGRFEDVENYGILRADYSASAATKRSRARSPSAADRRRPLRFARRERNTRERSSDRDRHARRRLFWCLEAIFEQLEGVHRVESATPAARLRTPRTRRSAPGRPGTPKSCRSRSTRRCSRFVICSSSSSRSTIRRR